MRAVDNDALEIRHKFFGFPVPVGQDRGGHHDEVGACQLFLYHVLDKGQRLDGLAKAHFVGKNAAKAVLGQEVQVGQALQLVASQGGPQALGGRDDAHFLEGVDLFPEMAPEGVRPGIRHVVQDAVQHGCLELLEDGLRGLGGIKAQGSKLVGYALQPFLGQGGVGSILQLHIALAAHPCLPDLFQGQGLPVVVHADVQGEDLVLLVADNLGLDGGLGGAHLVAGKGLFAIDAVALNELGIGVKQEGNGLLGLKEPELVGAGLEAYAGKLCKQVRLFLLVAADKVGLSLVGVAAGLEIRVGAAKGKFAVARLVDVVDFQGEQASFLVKEELGIVGCRLEDRLHDLEELFRLVEL